MKTFLIFGTTKANKDFITTDVFIVISNLNAKPIKHLKISLKGIETKMK